MSKLFIYNLFALLVGVLVFTSCGDDDTDTVTRVFEAGFSSNETGIFSAGETVNIEVTFTEPAISDVTVVLDIIENGVYYDSSQYETSVAPSAGEITLSVLEGAESASFSMTLLEDIYNRDFFVQFELATIQEGEETVVVAGDPVYTVYFYDLVSSGAVIDFETGGSNFPNHAYIDFSGNLQTASRRDSWELAFSSTDDNKVYLNSSLLVTAVNISNLTDIVDIDAVTSATALAGAPVTMYSYNQVTGETDEVAVNTVSDLMAGMPVSYSQYYFADFSSFTDSQDGSSTIITPVSDVDDENLVYVVNLGNAIPTEPNLEGGLNATGDIRGYYKIRILMEGEDYLLQYAEIDATTFSEVTISKDAAYNHTFFSLVNEQVVSVEPEKDSWDVNMIGIFSFFSYGVGFTYSDYMLHNTLGGVSLYQVTTIDDEGNATDDPSYAEFSIDDVVEENLDGSYRAVVGSGWRNPFVSPPVLNNDRYFVVKDAEGNYFKFEFTRLLSEENERGHAQMQYELL